MRRAGTQLIPRASGGGESERSALAASAIGSPDRSRPSASVTIDARTGRPVETAAAVAATSSRIEFIVSTRMRSTPAAARAAAISECSEENFCFGGDPIRAVAILQEVRTTRRPQTALKSFLEGCVRRARRSFPAPCCASIHLRKLRTLHSRQSDRCRESSPCEREQELLSYIPLVEPEARDREDLRARRDVLPVDLFHELRGLDESAGAPEWRLGVRSAAGELRSHRRVENDGRAALEPLTKVVPHGEPD